MRTISTAQQAALDSGTYRVSVRVFAEDGDGIYRNLSSLEGYDWVSDVEYGEEIDQPVAGATVRLWRNVHQMSLAPLTEYSKLNMDALAAYVPLLELGRGIYIQTATTPDEIAPGAGDWVEVFRGEIDDIDWGGSAAEIVLSCRDQGCVIQDAFIEDENAYGADDGSVLAEEAIQSLLDATLGAGVVTLYTPTASAWAVKSYKQAQEPLLQASENIAMERGWITRYKWDSGTSAFRFTFYGPDRSKVVPDHTFGPGDYLNVTRLRISRAGVRNVVRVRYTDSADGLYKDVEATDAASITKYGRRFMEIAEAASSQIDSAAEATTMAEACRDDLKDPEAEQEIELHYFFAAELGDLYRFTANGVHYDVDQDLAVVAVRHRLSENQKRTYLTVRGTPAGAYRKWHLREARPGIAPSGSFPATPTGLALTTGVEQAGKDTWAYLNVTWDRNTETNLDFYRLRYRKDPSDPSPGNWQYLDVARNLNPEQQIVPVAGNTEYGVQVAAVNTAGRASTWSSEVTTTSAADSTAPATPTGLAASSAIRGLVVTVNANSEIDWDGFEIHVSTSSGFTPGAGTLKAKGRATRFDVVDLTPETTYYVKAKAYDTSGNTSAATSQVSAAAGQADTADVKDEAVDLSKQDVSKASATYTGSGLAVGVGEVKSWPVTTVPTNTYDYLVSQPYLRGSIKYGANWYGPTAYHSVGTDAQYYSISIGGFTAYMRIRVNKIELDQFDLQVEIYHNSGSAQTLTPKVEWVRWGVV